MSDHVLSSAEIEFKVGELVHKFDLLECEVFIEAEVFPLGDKPMEYVPRVQEFFSSRTDGVQLTFSQTLRFVDCVRLAYMEFKKKYGEELKLDFPSVGTLSIFQNESSSSLETNSPD